MLFFAFFYRVSKGGGSITLLALFCVVQSNSLFCSFPSRSLDCVAMPAESFFLKVSICPDVGEFVFFILFLFT